MDTYVPLRAEREAQASDTEEQCVSLEIWALLCSIWISIVMTSSPSADPGDISAVRLRLLTPQEWASILSGDPREAACWVHAAARHGFKTAQVTWGQMLLDGRSVGRDPTAAYRWFRRAAEIGSIDGINMVGRCHELGWGVTVNHAEAMRWYEKAAAKSSDWGQYNLASMLLYGEGIERDRAQALQWYMRAAGQGHAKAMGMVGRFHEEGWEVPPDLALAAQWYRKAAEGDDFWSQYHLARLLADSRPGEALDWLGRAIEGGTDNFLRSAGPDLLNHPYVTFHDAGLRALERCCRSGEACDFYAYGRAILNCSRHEEAAAWLGRAARSGHRDARHSLSVFAGRREQPADASFAKAIELIRQLWPKRNLPHGSHEGAGQ
ncbi:hypothetical protein MAE02_01330 [Microvirga aerophila]|uniref:Sel1 repeat family protein n=2 Tax=Microvirga aerophila TaxID=670291 RepID=A0A512BKQ4_9HYPH|nr:hypothetical protein MAE02_01330 [Microvirga aerophila]